MLNKLKQQDINRFLVKLFIFSVLLFTMDRLIGYGLSQLAKNERIGDASVTSYGVHKVKEDLLVFGSSRASHHYNPKILEEYLKLSCFNFGRDGMNIQYSMNLFKLSLKKHVPKVVILDVMVSDLISGNDRVENGEAVASAFLPFVPENSELLPLISNLGPLEKYKLAISKIYAYNSRILPLIQHTIGIGQKNELGYEPLVRALPTEQKIKKDNRYTAKKEQDNILLSSLKEFVFLAKKNNIKLICAISPRYYTADDEQYINYLSAYFKKENVPFYNYTLNRDFISRPDLFADEDHLNFVGANLYTKMISDEITILN